MNSYTYVTNNPNSFIDPSGLLFVVPPISGSIGIGTIGAVGGAGGYHSPGQSNSTSSGIRLPGRGRPGRGRHDRNEYRNWNDEFPDLVLPPGMPDLVDPSDTHAGTESNQCPASGGPPSDPRERCFNGVSLQYAACLQSGTNPLLCQARRILGLLACSARSDDGDN